MGTIITFITDKENNQHEAPETFDSKFTIIKRKKGKHQKQGFHKDLSITLLATTAFEDYITHIYNHAFYGKVVMTENMCFKLIMMCENKQIC